MTPTVIVSAAEATELSIVAVTTTPKQRNENSIMAR